MSKFTIFTYLITVITLFAPPQAEGKSFVKGNLIGQLGNQMFVIAAATSLALEHNAEAVFPDLVNAPSHLDKSIPHNYEMMFSKLNTKKPKKKLQYSYYEPFFHYKQIPYRRNMQIFGYFQSEKYFIKHKNEIINLFSPSKEIKEYLYSNYSDIIDHPNSVAIHFRSYMKEDPNGNYYIVQDKNYYEKAMDLFSDDCVFIVFTNAIEECKKLFADIPKQVRFIEGEDYIYDFYLMSLCKHNIISNSTYSWWAAYINKNPQKKVIAPMPWFNPQSGLNAKDLLPESWVKIYKS